MAKKKTNPGHAKAAQVVELANQDTAGEYITKADAVATLGISARTLERLAQSGKLARYSRIVNAARRRGRRPVYYLRAQLEELTKLAPANAATTPN